MLETAGALFLYFLMGVGTMVFIIAFIALILLARFASNMRKRHFEDMRRRTQRSYPR